MKITSYEVISLVLGFISLIISIIAMIISNSANRKSHKAQTEANDLQRSVSKLAQQQLHDMEINQTKSNCIISLKLQPGGSHCFEILNNSNVDAHDINMEIIEGNLPSDEMNRLNHFIPIDILHSNQTTGFRINRRMDSPDGYQIKLEWKDPDGGIHSKIFHLRYD